MSSPAIKLPDGYQDAAPVAASGPKLPPGYEDAAPVAAQSSNSLMDLYEGIGKRIKANFDLPAQIRNASNAISEAILDVKQNGLTTKKHRLPEVIQTLKDTYSVPANVIGDLLSGAILHMGGAEPGMPESTPKPAVESAPLDLTAENKPYAGERTPPVTGPRPGTEPPAPKIADKFKPPIPGVNVPPSVARISEPVIPSEPPAPANPDYVPIRPSIERIIDEIKTEPAFKSTPREELDAKFSKILEEVQQEHAAEKAATQETPQQGQDLTPQLLEHLRQLRMRGNNPVAQAPRETLADFNARLAKIADARKAAQ